MLSGALRWVKSNQFFFAEENTGGENKQSVFGKEIFPFISNPYFNLFHMLRCHGIKIIWIISEKIIVGAHESETPPPLAQMVLTQCTSISELLVHYMAPPRGAQKTSTFKFSRCSQKLWFQYLWEAQKYLGWVTGT